MMRILSDCLETKATIANGNISVMCHVPLNISWTLTMTSQVFHKSICCLLKHGKVGPQVIQVLGYRVANLYTEI